MRSVVLFGAGASFGSEGIRPWSPPLGGTLFRELERCCASWRGLPAELNAAFADDFEQGMLDLVRTHPAEVAPLMRDMTAYFLQFAPQPGVPNDYSKLVAALGNAAPSVIFSTLNYECVLELALGALGLTIDYWGGAPERGVTSVWKLHGSCNFLPRQISARGAQFTPGVAFHTTLRAVDPSDASTWLARGTSLYAAVCLFTVHKPIQIGAAQITRLQQRWAETVRTADRVATVGTRPNAEDEHLWTPLAHTEAHVGFCGSRDSYESWHRVRDGRPTAYIGSRFGASIDGLAAFLCG